MTPVELFNLALIKVGHSKGITALTDATREAWTGALVYDTTLRATLRTFPWGFATKYSALTLVQGPTWDDDATVQAWSATATYAIGDVVDLSGTFYWALAQSLNQTPPNATYWTTDPTEEANGDWDYAYRWPTDCLFVRRVVPASGVGRKFDNQPIPFRIGRDVNGLLIYTDEPACVIEYTMIDCDNLWTDDLWIDAFTWRLAAMIAPSISRDEKMQEKCIAGYYATLDLARAVSSREQQLEKDGDSDWIAARN
jgi:hypothetical protein